MGWWGLAVRQPSWWTSPALASQAQWDSQVEAETRVRSPGYSHVESEQEPGAARGSHGAPSACPRSVVRVPPTPRAPRAVSGSVVR